MYAKRCAAFILLVVIVGLVSATENYMDYGGELQSYFLVPYIIYRLLEKVTHVEYSRVLLRFFKTVIYFLME